MIPSYRLSTSGQIAELRYEGTTSFEEWAVAVEAALADPASRHGIDLLLDRRGIPEPPSTQTVYQAVDFFERHRGDLRRVASVVEGGAVYGMFRMLEALSERTTVEVRVFKSYEEATEWLGSGCAAA